MSICKTGLTSQHSSSTYSGDTLPATLAHKAALATPPVPLILQLLVVLIVGNTAPQTADVYPPWPENAKTCGLVPSRMLRSRNFYLPNEPEQNRSTH